MGIFGKKKKDNPWTTVVLYKNDGSACQCVTCDILIKDSVILEYSIKFFNDPAPCYIHKGAVAVRLLAEVEEELSLLPKNEKLPAPPKFLSWAKDDCKYIKIVE